MKAALGYGASTCSYVDWLHADLIVFFGSNVANNQPVTTKYLHHAKQNGAQIAVVNPYREPGLERYWIPSIRLERAVRHRARRPLVRRAHRRRSRVPHRRVPRADRSGRRRRRLRAGSRRWGSKRRAIARWQSDWAALERESGATRDRMRGVRAAADRSPERRHRLVDGADPARARRRHDQGADERRPRARPARTAEPRPGADPRALRRAGRRRGRLRAGARRGRRRALRRSAGAFRARRCRAGRRRR